jgi:hypothetical protein
MQIVLRKIDGVLTPVFRSKDGPSFGTRPGAGAVGRFLMSPLIVVALIIALFIAFMPRDGRVSRSRCACVDRVRCDGAHSASRS